MKNVVFGSQSRRSKDGPVRRVGVMGLMSALACAMSCSAPPAPGAGQIFDPQPNHDFMASTGDVSIIGLQEHVVCYTLDGSEPLIVGGACGGGATQALSASRKITLGCNGSTARTTIQGIKLAFDWPKGNGTNFQTVSGNFLLNCAPPPADTDSDGIANARDNCPTIANPDQADSNGNGIGDACESQGGPDADHDGRPDTADNCPQVWNVNQGDDDQDGIGNVCDPTPRGDRTLMWANDKLAKAFVAWKDEIQCRMNNCQLPGGTGSWNAACDNAGGTVSWNVSLSGLRAISAFTYHNCENTVTTQVHDYATDPNYLNPMARVPVNVRLVVDGSFTQDTDFNGNGTERGMVNVTGDFTGLVASFVQIANKAPGPGGYFSNSCSGDPFQEEICAPNNLRLNFPYPDWNCEPNICPAPGTPLVDTDHDGVFDDYDNCPAVANPTQANADFDREGDACDSNTSTQDTDRDGVPDSGDNCPMNANPGQEDMDHDGQGDACDSVVDPDTDMDTIIDRLDNCPNNANTSQVDTDMDGLGDACDPTPNGMPATSHLKLKNGRCLRDTGSALQSSSSCVSSQADQQWVVLTAPGGKVFRNQATGQCINAASWAGTISMAACDMNAQSQQWVTERYDQGGFEASFPMRLKSAAFNYCLYSDGSGGVYASQGNCGLAGTESGRKIGIYPGGDFNVMPVQP